MIKTTVQHLLDVQAQQVEYYASQLAPVLATEFRQRVKEATGHYPRTDMEIDVAYSEIPRGGNLESIVADVRSDFAAIGVRFLDMTDDEIAKAIRKEVTQKNGTQIISAREAARMLKSKARTAHDMIKPYMGSMQWRVVADLMQGEEGPFFQGKMIELAELFASIPRIKCGSGELVGYVKYFARSATWYVCEIGECDDPLMCFGYADLFGDGQCGELGYFTLQEILKTFPDVEIDFHFTPGPIKQVTSS